MLDALEPENSMRHVALLTGLRHYLGPSEFYGQGVMADIPLHESEPRLDFPNFYYAHQGELFSSAERNGFTWSVHSAHTVFGFAVGQAMNMALTLSVYATICKELGMPFVCLGSEGQWNGITDVTDADLLGVQLIWAGTHAEGENEAFNITNGDVFRWLSIAAAFAWRSVWEIRPAERTAEIVVCGARPLPGHSITASTPTPSVCSFTHATTSAEDGSITSPTSRLVASAARVGLISDVKTRAPTDAA